MFSKILVHAPNYQSLWYLESIKTSKIGRNKGNAKKRNRQIIDTNLIAPNNVLLKRVGIDHLLYVHMETKEARSSDSCMI